MEKNKRISGFKIPENYFEEIEEQLFSKIEEGKFPETAGFNVPENYFETLEEKILKAVKYEEKVSKVIPLFPKKYFGYAAAIAAVVIFGFSFFNSKSKNENLDTIQLTAIDNYIEEGNLNLDLYDVTTLIDDEDIATLDFEKQQFSETNLENYLMEYMDEETLINEQ